MMFMLFASTATSSNTESTTLNHTAPPHFVGLSVPSDMVNNKMWSYFSKFIDIYNKNYSVDNFRERFNIFSTNIHRLILQDTAFNHDVKINQWGDLTPQEFYNEVGGGCFQSNQVTYQNVVA